MPKPAPIEALKTLVLSPEFAAVKASVEALDPALTMDDRVAAHLKAFRTGLTALTKVPELQPEEEPEEVEDGEQEPAAE